MVNRTEHHKKAILEALEKTLGVVTKACKLAKVGRTQYYTWLKEDEEFAKQVQEIDNVALDFAESSLHEQIKDKVPTSTIFYLKTKGRKRGYIETKDITNNGGSFTNPFEGLTLDQLEKLSKLNDDDTSEDID